MYRHAWTHFNDHRVQWVTESWVEPAQFSEMLTQEQGNEEKTKSSTGTVCERMLTPGVGIGDVPLGKLVHFECL